MNITLNPMSISGEITAPPSKSYMHRALICAALADGDTFIQCSSFSEDIKATMGCLKALGAKIEEETGGVRVFAIDKKAAAGELNCNESGTTLRFMLPLASVLGKECTISGAPRLGKRPLAPLGEELEKHGAVVKYGNNSFLPLYLSSKAEGGKYIIPGNISSQFVSGLLLALASTGEECEIVTTGKQVSTPYIDLTLDMQRSYGINIKKTEKGFIIDKGQKYISPKRTVIEGDYSNGAFFLVAGAIAAKDYITVGGLFENSRQGDSEIVDILKRMGARIERNKDKLKVYKSNLHQTVIDAENIPDLVPILCVAASFAEGETIINNITRLREKESDRVLSTLALIRALGGDIEAEDNCIRVRRSALHGGTVDGFNDHRIVMSGAVASLCTDGSVTIEGSEAVTKSFPDFFEKFYSMGVKN